jgi:hypothetical protein
MKSTTIDCAQCKGSGKKDPSKGFSSKNQCEKCNGYGYRHPPKGWLKKRTLNSGEYFYFLGTREAGESPFPNQNPLDYVELNGGGVISIYDAESYEPSYDRKKNFFFTKEEAREALSKIRKIINSAR